MIRKKDQKLKIAFVSNTGWYFYNFRLNFIEHLLKNDYEIHLICPEDIYANKIKKKGINVHYWNLKKTSKNLFEEINSIFCLYRIYKNIKPDLVHHFTIKGVLYGTIISNIFQIKFIFNSITGLGTFFIGNQIKDKLLNLLILPIYKFIIRSSKANLIFQNKHDLNYFIKKNISTKKNSYLIRGSGINTSYYKSNKAYNNFPKNKCWRILFPSRLIREKGINELIQACDSLWKKNKNFRLFIAGEYDSNRSGNISKKSIESISNKEYIEAIRYEKNMKNLYLETDIVILPSWREGLSRSLLEAGSMELPVITTNVPGCNDIVLHRKTGLLVKREDPKSIEKAIALLMNNENLCKIFSKNIRLHIEKYFTNDIVNNKTFDLYKKIINEKNKEKYYDKI